MNDEMQASKAKKARSPNYPSLDLANAIERARLVWDHERRGAAAPDVILAHLGYKSTKSGTALSTLAALKRFGLLVEDEQEGTKLRLSGIALDILLDPDAESQARRDAIRSAAMKPAIFAELWSKYGGPAPSDQSLRFYLVRERAFTDSAADEFILTYRRTLSFAKLEEQAQAADGSSTPPAPEKDRGAMTANTMQPPARASVVPPPALPPAGPSISFDLPGGNVLEVRLRSRVSPKVFARIQQIIELAEETFVEDQSSKG